MVTPRRILLAKVGFDGHDRGVKILASVLREAGHEVIYLGKYLTVPSVLEAAVEEDVAVIGLSFLGGAHLAYCREMLSGMRARGLDQVSLMVGGVIPAKDHSALEKMGVAAVFSANTKTEEIVSFLEPSQAPGGRP